MRALRKLQLHLLNEDREAAAIEGGATDDTLTGTDSRDTIRGRGGDDYIQGLEGRDKLYGGDGNDVISGFRDGESGPSDDGDLLDGEGGDDWLVGGGGVDTIRGGDGDDSLMGGLSGGFDQQDASDWISGGDGNDYVIANAGDDTVLGGDGDDYLAGNWGSDRMDGGAGFDRASFNFFTDSAGVAFDASTFVAGGHNVLDDGRGGQDTLDGIERLLITGTSFADTLTGSAAADLIDSGGGANQVNAGGGDDLVSDYSGDSQINLGDGDDRLSFNGSGGGHDTASGGAGVDVADLYWDNRWSAIAASLDSRGRLQASTADDLLSVTGRSFEALNFHGGYGNDSVSGGSRGETLYGGDGEDSLRGGGGDDELGGGGGNDTLVGGAGEDLYFWQHFLFELGSVVIDASGFAADGSAATVDDEYGGVDSIAGFEGVMIEDDVLDDTLVGSAGDDRLQENYGSDSLRGGDGSDLFLMGNFSTSVVEDPDSWWGYRDVTDGLDTIVGGRGSDTISYSYGLADYGQTFLPGAYIDLAEGFASLTGDPDGESVDRFSSIENAIGGDGADTIVGGRDEERLAGAAGGDSVAGGGRNDTLAGGLGSDTLTGGDGADRFLFENAELLDESVDRITDLSRRDQIDLSAIDANVNRGGNQAFTLADAFTGVAGQLVRVFTEGETRVLGDVDGDGEADFQLLLNGDHTAFTGFVL